VPAGVEQIGADIASPDGARQACDGAVVVYHCAQPDYTKWVALFPPLTAAVLDGAAAAGAKLVFADNLYVYGPPDGPMTEETPQRAEGSKGRTRVDMAAAILRAHADGKLRCTIGRSSDYYGPRGTATTAGDTIMKPALRGKRARWLGSLDQSHTLNYLEDMGRALVTLGERDEADGGVWHLPAAEPLTGRQFLTLVYEAAGQPAKLGVATRPMIRLAGLFKPLLRELNETLYQFERPFISDASKFETRLDRSYQRLIARRCGGRWSGSEACDCDRPFSDPSACCGRVAGAVGWCLVVSPVTTSNTTSVAAPVRGQDLPTGGRCGRSLGAISQRPFCRRSMTRRFGVLVVLIGYSCV
jgi:nucleoside-diphosphate-sugar epimerase